jgi:hypothetical protein
MSALFGFRIRVELAGFAIGALKCIMAALFKSPPPY